MTSSVTAAGAASVYAILSVSSAPSPSGEITAGASASGGASEIVGTVAAPSEASRGRALSPAALRASRR